MRGGGGFPVLEASCYRHLLFYYPVFVYFIFSILFTSLSYKLLTMIYVHLSVTVIYRILHVKFIVYLLTTDINYALLYDVSYFIPVILSNVTYYSCSYNNKSRQL